MSRQTEAEELIRLMRELGQLSEHEDTKLTTRGRAHCSPTWRWVITAPLPVNFVRRWRSAPAGWQML